jgi:hypothetical protein
VILADADEIFFMLASVDASFVAAQTAIALEAHVVNGGTARRRWPWHT